MHHKRKGPKSTRAGCLMCKPHKRQGTRLMERDRFSVLRQKKSLAEEMTEAGLAPRRVRVPGGQAKQRRKGWVPGKILRAWQRRIEKQLELQATRDRAI